MPFPPNPLQHSFLSDIPVIGLNESDAAALAALYVHCFDDVWSADSFLSMFQGQSAKAFGMRQNSGLIAFVLLMPCVDDMEIIKIATHPDCRNSGLGEKLMKSAINFARSQSSERLLLEVAANNLNAQRLYEKSGFRKDGIRPGYYPQNGAKPIDAILMSLDLSD